MSATAAALKRASRNLIVLTSCSKTSGRQAPDAYQPIASVPGVGSKNVWALLLGDRRRSEENGEPLEDK